MERYIISSLFVWKLVRAVCGGMFNFKTVWLKFVLLIIVSDVVVEEKELFDVLVDLRKESPTFSIWFGIELSAENFYQLFIPKGFAHGFLSISENAEILYKTSDYWNPLSEITIIWNILETPNKGILFRRVENRH